MLDVAELGAMHVVYHEVGKKKSLQKNQHKINTNLDKNLYLIR